MIDFCWFLPLSRIFHSYKDSSFPIKSRPILINHLLLRHTRTVPNFETIKQSSHKILRICGIHWLGGYYYMISNLYECYQIPNHKSVMCVLPNSYNLLVASHTYVPGCAYSLSNFLLFTGKKWIDDNYFIWFMSSISIYLLVIDVSKDVHCKSYLTLHFLKSRTINLPY